MDTTHQFVGQVFDFPLGPNPRKFVIGAIRYGNFRKFTRSEPFNSKTGEGEQRAVIESQATKLRNAMLTGKYSPTMFYLGTRDTHRQNVTVQDGVASLLVNESDPLPIVDGGNRTAALQKIWDEDKSLRLTVDNIYIPFALNLNGNTRQDFVNYQEGKPVSKDHMLSMKIASHLLDDNSFPVFNVAKEIAFALHTNSDSFCHHLIQFDSSGAKLPLSFNSLASKKDSGLTLYGTSLLTQKAKKDSAWAANLIVEAYETLSGNVDTATLLDQGNILSPIPDGTKAGTSLLIGVGNMLIARMWLAKRENPTQEDLDLLVVCADENLREPTRGNTSADRKREIFHNFVEAYFYDLLEAKHEDDMDNIGGHEGVPVPLVNLLGPGTFGVSKLPTVNAAGKKRGRPKKTTDAPKVEPETPKAEPEPENAPVKADEPKVDGEDPVDKKAFEDMDNEQPTFDDDNVIEVEETAPWDTE